MKMSVLSAPRIRLEPRTEEDRVLIRSELTRLTVNVHFAGSKRYPALLRYIVEKALEGLADELKERTIGIDVFHRPPDYDTNSDTVVRVTAGEVRKRLALTYHESEEDHTIQISLPVGSYVPEFYRLTAAVADAPLMESPVQPAPIRETSGMEGALAFDLTIRDETSPDVMPPPALPRRTEGSKWRAGAIGLSMLAVGLLAGFWLVNLRMDTADRFWSPLRSSGAPVLFCVGALIPTTSTSVGFTVAEKSDDYPYISMATAGALASVVSQLDRDRMNYVIEPSSSSTLTDMRLHPTVLMGAYDNKWTFLLLKDLRFRFAERPLVQIYDTQNPSRIWSRAKDLPYKDKDDYAIVARFHDKVTDNMMMVIAGLGKNGTEAAAQFVTSSRYLDLIKTSANRGWESRNIEIVLKTNVVDSKTGSPSIEAVAVW